ncbi:hypothetical protein [Algibacillus agarilyticus]|nr:hypothetical protein [Algibacillus agarilyticus]
MGNDELKKKELTINDVCLVMGVFMAFAISVYFGFSFGKGYFL